MDTDFDNYEKNTTGIMIGILILKIMIGIPGSNYDFF